VVRGVILAVVLLILVGAAGLGGLYYLGSRLIGERLDFGNGQEVYYAEGATKEQADALGRALLEEKYFVGSESTVHLARAGNGFVISFVVRPGLWNQETEPRYFLLLGGILSGKVFHDAPVEVRMCDEYVQPHKTIAARRLEFGPGEWVYFPAEVPEAEVRVLGRVLKEVNIFDGKGSKDTFLENAGGRLVVSAVVTDGAWDRPAFLDEYRAFRAKFSQALGGRDVEVRLLDKVLTRRATIS
jgi:hypothetical protein